MASTTVTIKKADPTALGIFSYGFSLFILSIYAMGFYPWSESIVMIAPALVFGGALPLIGSIIMVIPLVLRRLARTQRSF
jgi:succinate-acetate transporter protein